MTPHLIPGHAPDGTPILSVLGKETFEIAPGEAPWFAEEEISFRESDEDLETDLVAFKPMTDLLLTGSVFAPRGKKAFHMDAGIAVGRCLCAVRVFGDRRAAVLGNSVRFSEAESFESMPVSLSRCYGGVDTLVRPGEPFAYPPNPHGTGFLVAGTQEVTEIVLPNFEDPSRLLAPDTFLLREFARWPQAPLPASLAPLPRDTHPRRTFAGVSPDQAADQEVERRKRIQSMPEVGAGNGTFPPAPPAILNPEYHQAAPPGLRFPLLSGSETINLQYFHPDHPRWDIALPGGSPVAWIDTGHGPESVRMVVQTVELRLDLGKLALTWRGSLYYGGPAAMANFTRLEYGIED
jgi:hypothetical protein